MGRRAPRVFFIRRATQYFLIRSDTSRRSSAPIDFLPRLVFFWRCSPEAEPCCNVSSDVSGSLRAADVCQNDPMPPRRPFGGNFRVATIRPGDQRPPILLIFGRLLLGVVNNEDIDQVLLFLEFQSKLRLQRGEKRQAGAIVAG